MGHRRRIAALLGCNIISFENFESGLFQTPVVCFGFKSKTGLTCSALIGICHHNATAAQCFVYECQNSSFEYVDSSLFSQVAGKMNIRII